MQTTLIYLGQVNAENINWWEVGGLILGSFSFSPLLIGREGGSMLRLHFGQVGVAEMHLQDNRVWLSQRVYTLSVAESGQVERVQPLSRHTCVNVDVCLCRRSNLEGAGGCSLFDVINSLCSLLAARREPVNILPHAPLFIFHVLLTASVLRAHPIPSSLAVITVAYDVNDNVRHAFTILLLNWKKRKKNKFKVLKMSKVSFMPLCQVSLKKQQPTMSRGSKLSKLLKKRWKERKISSKVWSECK